MSTESPFVAQVHRFGDSVALSTAGKGATIYLTPKAARELARALRVAARSVKLQTFTTSTVGTVTVRQTVETDIHHGGQIREKR